MVGSRGTEMTVRGKWLVWILVVSFPCLIDGCRRSPEARKKAYLDKAASYFQDGKIREAAIEYENAIQVDPKDADAHFGLAQCFLKQDNLRAAYQELSSTVKLDPANLKAQMDLGFQVRRVELDGTRQFLVGGSQIVLLQEALCQAEVGVCIFRINLDRVFILDRCFADFSVLKVRGRFVQVGLLPCFGAATAAVDQARKRDHQNPN